jgi:hypothetical protein
MMEKFKGNIIGFMKDSTMVVFRDHDEWVKNAEDLRKKGLVHVSGSTKNIYESVMRNWNLYDVKNFFDEMAEKYFSEKDLKEWEKLKETID